MTVSKYEGAVRQLASGLPAEQLRAVRFIKNSIIGNKSKKELYVNLGIIPKLVALFPPKGPVPSGEAQILVQAAVVLGSVAFGTEHHVRALVDGGAIPPLLVCLGQTTSPRLVEASARALKAIYLSPAAPKHDLFQNHYLQNLVALLSWVGPSPQPQQHIYNQLDSNEPPYVPEIAASIIASCSDTSEHQAAFVTAGAVLPLLRLLASSHVRCQGSALCALAALVKDNAPIAKAVIDARTERCERPATLIFQHIRHSSPSMRLAACMCLVNFSRAGITVENVEDVPLLVLPTLVKLFSEASPIKETAAFVLAYLVSVSEDLQKAACDAGAVPRLAEMISRKEEECENSEQADRLREAVLTAIAAVSSLKEECRKQVIEAKILPHIVSAMSHRSVGVRAAACQCTRSLSRSVKSLRTSLVDAGIAIPLFNLLGDESVAVQTTASATLCNIVLDFSPMKKTVLENGGVERLVGLVSSMDANLRLNSVWALKNLLFQADSEIKQTVMRQLKYSQLISLIDDTDLGIQEQALNLLRNLACGKESDIQEVFDGIGEDKLMRILEYKLRSSNEEIVLQTLYVIVNIATGNERHKMGIMHNENLLKSVYCFMSHEKANIRVATVWCIINLTWSEERHKGSQDRLRRLEQLGFEEKLKSMSEDPDLDVRDRVKTALGHFAPENVGIAIGSGDNGSSGRS